MIKPELTLTLGLLLILIAGAQTQPIAFWGLGIIGCILLLVTKKYEGDNEAE